MHRYRLQFVVLLCLFTSQVLRLFATNSPPLVEIVQPLTNTIFLAPAEVVIHVAASASDTNGQITLVEFFEGTNKLAETTIAPYTFTWSLVPTGSYTLTAVATDNEGATNISLPVPIRVDLKPTASILSPTNDANFLTPTNVIISAEAFDNVAVTNVEFFANDTKLGELAAPPFDWTWIAPPLGLHELSVRATDNYGLSTISQPVTIFVTTGGGTLVAAVDSVAQGSVVDLTVEGTNDWVHWGHVTQLSLNRKAGVAPQIGNFSRIDAGPNEVFQFADNYNGYSWSDGTPLSNVTNTTTGVYIVGEGKGFQVTAPADTNLHTLKLYVGSYGSRGKMLAYLDDFTAPIPVDASLDNTANGPGVVYTFTYSAATPGRTLVVRFTTTEAHTSDGNVTLQAAAFSRGNHPPFVVLTNPANFSVFPAPANVVLSADASDPDGSVAKVEFFRGGTTQLGETTNAPYSLTWSNVVAGTYTLTAKATDNQGVTFVSAPVTVFVTNVGGFLSGTIAPAPAAVNLSDEGTLDWVHWGFLYPIHGTQTAFINRKANVIPQLIPNYTVIGNADDVAPFTDNLAGFSWTNGVPITNAANSTTGIYNSGLNEGFRLTLPADTTWRRVKVYFGAYAAQTKLEATLSDFSAAPYIDSSVMSINNAVGVCTLNYAAASPDKVSSYESPHPFCTMRSVEM